MYTLFENRKEPDMKLFETKFKKRRLVVEWIPIQPMFLGLTAFNGKTIFTFGFELVCWSLVFTYYKKRKK